MTTNLVRDGKSFRWHLDFAAMERLLRDFFVTGVWDVIESPDPQHDVHIVKATRSNAITRTRWTASGVPWGRTCASTNAKAGTRSTPSAPT